MGIDPGGKRLGVAISDPGRILARGLALLEAAGETSVEDRIADLAREHDVAEIVVGLPLNMNGTEGEQAGKARDLGGKIRGLTGLKVEFWDERLTSRQAERIFLAADLSRKKRRRGIDLLAARIILQSYLDSV